MRGCLAVEVVLKIAGVQVPSSKSITHRALFCAAMAQGKSTIVNPLVCDDTLTTIRVLEQLGIRIEKFSNEWVIHGGTFQTPKEELFCNESGTTFRFVTALTSVLEIPCTITGKPSLIKRGAAPSSDVSSQYVSGMLLARPETKMEVKVSKPYVALTLAVQKAFGVDAAKGLLTYKPTTYVIEGDWSSAAFLLAASFLTGREIQLKGLNAESLQADREIVAILKTMETRQAIEWDLTNCPDLYPIVAALCTTLKGESILKGIKRLRYKESNRIKAMEEILAKMRNGDGRLKACMVDSTDHRIIMAAAVLGLVAEGQMEFKYPGCVAKSFPGFWQALPSLL